jgi:hydroxyacylglutathione hydrolase
MKNNTLYFEQLERGPLDNLLYILADMDEKKAVFVDPAWDVPYLLRKLETLSCTLDKIILTHGHHDHVNGIPEILAHFPDTPIYLSHLEADFLTPNYPQNLVRTTEDDLITLGQYTLKVTLTPGHTAGGQCFIFEDQWILTGDTLFINGCGRCDLRSGNVEAMYDSLTKLKQLPDALVIYPGHRLGTKTQDTLEKQKKSNVYLKLSKEEFLIRRN